MEDSNCWDCSVCTFRNSPEAFKCLMCDVRKGTSTRKPRINPEMVAKQVARQQEQIKQQALKSVVKPRSIGSEKSAFHRTDDNSNSSISSSYDSSGRISPVQNGSNCSNGSASSLSTAISTSSFFDMNSSNNTFNTASSSSKTTLNLPSSSRVSSKIDSEEEVDENELERKKPVMSNQNCNKSANRKIGKTILGPKAKLKNVDRSDALYKEVTVNNFTVLITEFKPKRKLSEFSENHQNKSTTDLGSNSNKKIKDPSGGAGDLGSPSSKSNPKSNNEQKKSPNKSINNSKSKEDQPTKKRNLQSGSDSLSSDHHGQPHLNNNNSVSKKMLPGVEQATK